MKRTEMVLAIENVGRTLVPASAIGWLDLPNVHFVFGMVLEFAPGIDEDLPHFTCGAQRARKTSSAGLP